MNSWNPLEGDRFGEQRLDKCSPGWARRQLPLIPASVCMWVTRLLKGAWVRAEQKELCCKNIHGNQARLICSRWEPRGRSEVCSVAQGRQDINSAACPGQAKLWREYKQRGWLCAGNQSAAVCGTGELPARERPAGLRGAWGRLVHGSHAAALCQRGRSKLCSSAPESTLLLWSRRTRLFEICITWK